MNNSPDSSQVLSTSHTKIYSTSHAPQILKSSSYHSQLISGSRHALSLQSSGSIISLENSSIKSDNPAWGDSTALAESLSQKKKEADIIRRKCIAIETKLENEKQKIKLLEEEISEISKKRNEKVLGKRENDPRVVEINKEKEKKDKEIGKLKEVIMRIEQEEGKIKGEIQKLQGEWNKYKVKSGEENKKIQSEIEAIDEILGKKKIFDEKEIENDIRVKEAKERMEKIMKEIYEIKRNTEKKDEEEKELLRSIGEIKMKNEMLMSRLKEREIEQKNKEKELQDEIERQEKIENNTTKCLDIDEQRKHDLVSEEIISFHNEVKPVYQEALEESSSWQIDFEPPIEVNLETPVQEKEIIQIEILDTTTHEVISKKIIDIESHKHTETLPKTNGLLNGIHKENSSEIHPTFNENVEFVINENVWGIDEDLQIVTEISSEKAEKLSPIQNDLIDTKTDFIEPKHIINSFENKDIEKIEISDIIETNDQKSSEIKIDEPTEMEEKIEPEISSSQKLAEEIVVEATKSSDFIEISQEKPIEIESNATETIKEQNKIELEIPDTQKPAEEIKVEILKPEPSSLPKPKPLFANKPKFAAPTRKIPTQKKVADINYDPDDFFQEMSKKTPQKQFK